MKNSATFIKLTSINNVMFIYLIHLIPCGVKITLDNPTYERFAPHVDLDIGVTFAFYHAPH